jgi:diacylglycerol kinase family enzyme
MKVDVFSVTQGGKRSISFMSQTSGLMADLDIGTENLRWMGDARFVFGFIRECKSSFCIPSSIGNLIKCLQGSDEIQTMLGTVVI